MGNSSNKAFSLRLREEMIAQGYGAVRSNLGADPNTLKEAIGVNSVTSARKWLSGEAIPRLDKLKAIADWLGVRVSWLRDGDEPKYKSEKLVNKMSVNRFASLPNHYRRLFENLEQLSVREKHAIMELVKTMAEVKSES